MAEAEQCGCRWCCLAFLFSIGLAILLYWVATIPTKPRYYITDFSLFSLPAGNLTALASYTLEIENKNAGVGVDHEPISLSLSLSFTSTTNSSANATIAGFYQGEDRTADKSGYFTGDRRTPAAWSAKVSNGSAVFRVAIESAFRYKSIVGKGKRHIVSLAGDVAVDKVGKKTMEKGIRLSAASRVAVRYCGANLLLGLIVCVIMI